MNRLLFILVVLVVACPNTQAQVIMTADKIKQRQEELSRTTGYIVGTVTDKETGAPLERVHVSANYMGDVTDEHGRYNVPYQKPGAAQVVAYRRDYIASSSKIVVVAGKATNLDISMKRQDKPCCMLEGDWRAVVIYGTGDSRREVTGTIQFNRNTPDPMPSRKSVANDSTIDEFGRYDIDLKALLGDNYTDTGSTTVFGGNIDTILIEAVGYVYNINHVTINLIPRMSHGGLTLEGQMEDNLIKGKWHLRAYAVSKAGEFTMERTK